MGGPAASRSSSSATKRLPVRSATLPRHCSRPAESRLCTAIVPIVTDRGADADRHDNGRVGVHVQSQIMFFIIRYVRDDICHIANCRQTNNIYQTNNINIYQMGEGRSASWQGAEVAWREGSGGGVRCAVCGRRRAERAAAARTAEALRWPGKRRGWRWRQPNPWRDGVERRRGRRRRGRRLR